MAGAIGDGGPLEPLINQELLPSLLRTVAGEVELDGFRGYMASVILLDVTAVTAVTLDLYIQRRLPGDGDFWDDIAHLTATGVGRKVADIYSGSSSGSARVPRDTTLAADNVEDVQWGDKIKVKWTITGTNVTFSVQSDWS